VSDFHGDCKQQLMAAAGTLFATSTPAARTRRRRARRRHIPLLAAIALGALLLAAAAYAATQIIGVGAPVHAPHERERSSASTGVGVPVSGATSPATSAQLLAISVPDPGGGLPWGMRIVRTTRGLDCMQIGRLLDGRLGVLGQDGEFDDDRLFHELPVNVLDPDLCLEPSQRVVESVGLPAAGALQSPTTSCLAPGERTLSRGPRPCPAGDNRTIAFGVLGSHAVSVSYPSHGTLHTVATAGSHGAYLIVLRAPAKQRNVAALGGSSAPIDDFPIGTGSSDVISRLLFRFGDGICQTGFNRQRGGPPQCTNSFSRTPVFVPEIPRGLHTRVTVSTFEVLGGHDLAVAFRAPAAVYNASTAYDVEYTLPHTRACGIPGGYGQAIERDVARGQIVHVSELVIQPNGCHGVVHGKVTLERQTFARGGFASGAETIGRFSFKLP
jgi:hypothetical protein